MPLTLAAPAHSELLIRKSRFIGCVQAVADRTEALAIVARLRVGHPGAAHVCWALLAGGQSAANDDGEPGGTAGRPMLEVLRHQDLEGVLATVVRYFGGVKLGAGGLVRAYTDAVAQALLKADKVPLRKMVALRCTVPYALEGTVRRELQQAGALLADVAHGDIVRMGFTVAQELAGPLAARLNDAAQGALLWEAQGPDAPAAAPPPPERPAGKPGRREST